MAESYTPTEFSDKPLRRRYPWDVWESEPFKVWTLYRHTDFDCPAENMAIMISTRSKRNASRGLRAANVSVQDHHDGSLSFCFYGNNDLRPIVGKGTQMPGPRAITPEAATAMGLEAVTCDYCGTVQERVPHLVHIKTCLTNTPGKGTTADHYDNMVCTLMTSYTREGGPTNE